MAENIYRVEVELNKRILDFGEGCRYRVVVDYQSAVQHPLELRAGDMVQVNDGKEKWPGWVYCTDQTVNTGWVPERYLLRRETGAVLCKDYNGKELTVKAGDELLVCQVLTSWSWCLNEKGEPGWVPTDHVEKLP